MLGWKETHPGALRAQGVADTLPTPLQHRLLGTLTGSGAPAPGLLLADTALELAKFQVLLSGL